MYRNDVRQEKVRPKSTSDLTGKKIIVSPDILAGQDKGYMFESKCSIIYYSVYSLRVYTCCKCMIIIGIIFCLDSYSQPSPERSASPVITQRHYRSNSTGKHNLCTAGSMCMLLQVVEQLQ